MTYESWMFESKRNCFCVTKPRKEGKMRFEVEEVKDERINEIFGDVYKIKDNCDGDSPVNYFRLLKPRAIDVCEWLNENIEYVSYKDRVNEVIDELWDIEEIRVERYKDMVIVVEKEDTKVFLHTIEKKIPNARVYAAPIEAMKSVYIIMEDN